MHTIARVRSSDDAQSSSGQPVVLIVSGDLKLRTIAAQIMQREGWGVLMASHAGHALLACLRAPRIDVVVAELSMDEMSGPALAGKLRRLRPEIAAVYVAQPGTTECHGVLVRPFTNEDLLGSVASARAARHITAAS